MIHKRILTPRHLAGASIATAALATGLNAGAAAAALTFNFGFNGDGEPTKPSSVTGTISGLVDNVANQTTGLTAIITAATNTPPGGWPIFSTYYGGNGISVLNGVVASSNVSFSAGDSYLNLSNSGLGATVLQWQDPVVSSFWYNNGIDSLDRTTLVFTSAPGPLPVFGAASAFGFSRRLRRRLNHCRGVVRRAGAISG